MAKNPKRLMLFLSVMAVIIFIVALSLVIVAIQREEYVIAVAMALVAVWQIYNLITWRKFR